MHRFAKIKHIQSKKRTVGDVHVSKNGTYYDLKCPFAKTPTWVGFGNRRCAGEYVLRMMISYFLKYVQKHKVSIVKTKDPDIETSCVWKVQADGLSPYVNQNILKAK